MRKPLMMLAIIACLVISVIGSLLPILQGWIFFVIALYLLATEFKTGRQWVTWRVGGGRLSTAGSARRGIINGHRATSGNSTS